MGEEVTTHKSRMVSWTDTYTLFGYPYTYSLIKELVRSTFVREDGDLHMCDNEITTVY